MSLEDNKAVVVAVLTSMFNGDFAALDRHPGMAESRKVFPNIRAVCPDMIGEILDVVAEGDTVATRARLRGTHALEFLGVPATHKAVEFDTFGFDRVLDGLIVQHNATADLVDILSSIRADSR